MAMFKRIAAFTDIHFGRKNDSEQHNRDCLDYVEWFCQQVVEQQCDRIIFLGDWYHNQSRLRHDTQWYSRQALDRLVGLGLPFDFLIGNHDMFFRDNRNIHSNPFIDLYENINVINEITQIDDALLCPYLVGDEFTSPPNKSVRYVFGHFAFPGFLVNEMIEMPDKGGIHSDMFVHPEWVFCGHFHKRQIKPNQNDTRICYIGNTFPMDFNDVGDRDRGCMILEHGGYPEFLNWTDGPNYSRVLASELLSDSDLLDQFNSRSEIECQDDIDLSDEDALSLKESLQSVVRDFWIKPKIQESQIDQQIDFESTGQNIDETVVEYVSRMDTEGSKLNRDLLIRMYREA